MALYEYYCDPCQLKFEELTGHRAAGAQAGTCPKCSRAPARRLFSRFAISGQGDLRETTFHGCHDAHVSLPGESHSHEHSHSHSHSHSRDSGSGHGHGHDHD